MGDTHNTTKPKLISNLPERNRFFTGREDVLNQLSELLKSNREVAIKQAIAGLGGIGKTQTAIEFCYRHINNDSNNYQTFLWVRSENEIDFNNSYYELAKLLKLLPSTSPESNQSNQSNPSNPLKIEQIIDLVKEWLATNSNWLMVLDNLEDPSLVKQYLPNNHNGHILITTRDHNLGQFANTITLDKMDANTGCLFLLKRLALLQKDDSLDKVNEDIRKITQELAKQMDGLPLALDQAAAYVQNTNSIISSSCLEKYLTLYQDAKQSAKLRDTRGKHTNDHISVTATFSIGFDKVKEKNPIAAKVLQACSFLSSDSIPEEIFTQNQLQLLLTENSAYNSKVLYAIITFFLSFLSFLKINTSFSKHPSLIATDLVWDEIIKILLTYSLVKRDPTNQTLSIHRLVQAVIRDLMDDSTKKIYFENLVNGLEHLRPDSAEDPKNWPKYQRLLPSASALFEIDNTCDFLVSKASTLFHEFGFYCNDQALFAQSLALYNQALVIYKHHFGHNHPSVAASLNNIASVYSKQGNYEQALTPYNQSLAIYKHLFGHNHPSVAASLNNIASVYSKQGNYEQALTLYNQSLTIRKHHFGDNHPDVALALNNIALVYNNLGNNEQALTLYNQSLAIAKHHFGDNHPNVARTLNNIALVYSKQGNYEQALVLYNQALTIKKHHFGDNHPDVALALNNIALVYSKQGNYEQALDLYNQALTIDKHHFGDNHPDIALTFNNIAAAYDSQGNYEQALTLYNQALAIDKHHFGDNHPSVAGTLNNIALVYYKQGEYEQALTLYNQSLTIYKHYFGNNHPDVAVSLWSLASLYASTSKEIEAIEYYKQALSIFDNFLPPNHPNIIQLLKMYSELLLKLNRNDEAQPLLNRLELLNLSD